MFGRIQAAILRSRARGLEPDAIFWGQGEHDGGVGTSAGSVTQSIRNIVDAIREAPLSCNAPFYVGQYTMVGGVTSANVRAGIASAVEVARNIKFGDDADANLTVAGGFRLADGAHASDTGLAVSATAWTTFAFP